MKMFGGSKSLGDAQESRIVQIGHENRLAERNRRNRLAGGNRGNRLAGGHRENRLAEVHRENRLVGGNQENRFVKNNQENRLMEVDQENRLVEVDRENRLVEVEKIDDAQVDRTMRRVHDEMEDELQAHPGGGQLSKIVADSGDVTMVEQAIVKKENVNGYLGLIADDVLKSMPDEDAKIKLGKTLKDMILVEKGEASMHGISIPKTAAGGNRVVEVYVLASEVRDDGRYEFRLGHSLTNVKQYGPLRNHNQGEIEMWMKYKLVKKMKTNKRRLQHA